MARKRLRLVSSTETPKPYSRQWEPIVCPVCRNDGLLESAVIPVLLNPVTDGKHVKCGSGDVEALYCMMCMTKGRTTRLS